MATVADTPPLSLLCRRWLPIFHPGSPGCRVSQPGLTGPVCQFPNSSSPPPSRRSVSGPFPVRGEAPSWASQGARSAGIPGQAHITVCAPSPPCPATSCQDPCPLSVPHPGPQGAPRGSPHPLVVRALGLPDHLPGGAGFGAPSSAASSAHRAPSRPTFSGEVFPGPAGGRRFS